MSAHGATAVTITASQDHTLRRGPTIENGIHIKASTNNSTDRVGMFRFDSGDFGVNVTDATFLLTANSNTSVQFQGGPYTYRVWGVNDGDPQDELFVEGGYNPSDAGTIYDNSGNLIQESQLTNLGDSAAISAGDTINLNTAALLAFIQADTNGTVTLVVERLTVGANSTFLDRTSGSPPRLDLTLVPEPSSLALLGLGGLLVARRRRG